MKLQGKIDFPIQQLGISFSSPAGEGLGNHFEERALVDADIPAAGTEQAAILFVGGKIFFDPAPVTPENFSRPDLVVFQQFAFTGGTLDDEHFLGINQI